MNQTARKPVDQAHPVKDARAIRFSRHANERLRQRGLRMSGLMKTQLIAAMDTLAEKGGRSALVMFDQLVMLVSVSKRTVITVMGRETLEKNIFTDIDSVIFVSA